MFASSLQCQNGILVISSFNTSCNIKLQYRIFFKQCVKNREIEGRSALFSQNVNKLSRLFFACSKLVGTPGTVVVFSVSPNYLNLYCRVLIILVFPKRRWQQSVYAIWHPYDQLRIYESHKKPFMYCHMCRKQTATAITPNPQTDAFFNRVTQTPAS